MGERTISIDRSALYDICEALNAQAAHFDTLAIDNRFPASARDTYTMKANAYRRLTGMLLDRWDAAQNTKAAVAA